MSESRKHLKETVIPLLKHAASSVETRDCWGPILEKNRVKLERAMNDARAMN